MTNRVSTGPTPAQARAITAPPGPLLVVAGPGAGKTFCLIERIRHLILDRGIPADRLCAVTYTNKAAGEIAMRLDETMPGVSVQVRRGTVHSVAVEILRAWPVEAGLEPGFGIADDAAQMAVLSAGTVSAGTISTPRMSRCSRAICPGWSAGTWSISTASWCGWPPCSTNTLPSLPGSPPGGMRFWSTSSRM
jgi:DNA helicase-2/ATP-dependent DNA helicase PcrA